MTKQFKLTDDQQYIFDSVVDKIDNSPGRYDCVIRGYAGTGKSTTISRIIKELAAHYTVAVTSPTHKANQVLSTMMKEAHVTDVDVMTIHSFLGLKLVNKKQKQVLELDKNSPNAKKMVDVLIIDECSMISTDLYMHLLNASHRVRRAIIFVGDECQLPPVEPEKPNTIVSCTFSHGEQYALTEVLRQALENPILALATAMRGCIDTNVDPLSHIYAVPDDCSTVMKTHCSYSFLDTYYSMVSGSVFDTNTPNMSQLYDNVGNYKILSYTNRNVDFMNANIRKRLFPDVTDELIHGEPIVFDETNLNCPYTNQQVIRCPQLTKDNWMGIDCWRVDVAGDKSFYVVGPQTKHMFKKVLNDIVTKINLKQTNPFTKRPYTWADYYIIKEKMNVVGYPYATTYHKSQGSTFDMVWMDLEYVSNVQAINDKTRMLYTGSTRPREGLIIKT